MLLLGSLSMREFSEFNYLWKNPPNHWTEARRLQQVLGYLKVKDVSRVFSMNGHAGFATDVLQQRAGAREMDVSDQPIPGVCSTTVNRALTNGEPVAVVGYTHSSGAPGCWDIPICTGGLESMVANPESMFTVDGKHFVYVGADRELLRKLGFRFWD